MKQEALVDSLELRNRYMGRVDVLEKVKILSFLPNTELMSTQMVCEYFETDYEAIKKIMQRHLDELKADGIEFLEGKELRDIKSLSGISSRARHMSVFTRKAVLRVGMLLRDSEVAKQLRTYLLNIEQEASQQQRSTATRGSKWDGKDLILYDRIIVGVSKGKTLTDICNEVAVEIGETSAACRNRYSQTIKKKIKNEELVRRIEGNRRGHAISHEQQDEMPTNSVCRIPRSEELYFNHVVQSMIEMDSKIDETLSSFNKLEKELIDSQKFEIERLKKENLLLKNKNKKLREEKQIVQDNLHSVRAVVASAIKVRIDEEIAQTFKMDKNGNLERI